MSHNLWCQIRNVEVQFSPPLKDKNLWKDVYFNLYFQKDIRVQSEKLMKFSIDQWKPQESKDGIQAYSWQADEKGCERMFHCYESDLETTRMVVRLRKKGMLRSLTQTDVFTCIPESMTLQKMLYGPTKYAFVMQVQKEFDNAWKNYTVCVQMEVLLEQLMEVPIHLHSFDASSAYPLLQKAFQVFGDRNDLEAVEKLNVFLQYTDEYTLLQEQMVTTKHPLASLFLEKATFQSDTATHPDQFRCQLSRSAAPSLILSSKGTHHLRTGMLHVVLKDVQNREWLRVVWSLLDPRTPMDKHGKVQCVSCTTSCLVPKIFAKEPVVQASFGFSIDRLPLCFQMQDALYRDNAIHDGYLRFPGHVVLHEHLDKEWNQRLQTHSSPPFFHETMYAYRVLAEREDLRHLHVPQALFEHIPTSPCFVIEVEVEEVIEEEEVASASHLLHLQAKHKTVRKVFRQHKQSCTGLVSCSKCGFLQKELETIRSQLTNF